MNIPKYMNTHFFKNVDLDSFERLTKWAYSRLEVNENEWNRNDFIYMLENLSAKNPHTEFQYWIKRRVVVPILRPEYYIFGNTTLQHYLIAKSFNSSRIYDDLIDNCSREPWGSILCHLIWIQEEDDVNDIIKSLTKIIPDRDGGFDKSYLKQSEKFLDDYYEKLPISSRNRLRNDLDKSFQYFPQRNQGPVTVFKIHLSDTLPDKLTIRNVTKSIQGSKITADLPYTANTLRSILKLLNEGVDCIDNNSFDMENLETAGLANNKRIAENYLDLIGKKLYDAILLNNVIPEFIVARKKEEPVILELLFDPSDILLSQFPWELMFDGVIPLVVPNNEVYLIRSLADETSNDYLRQEKSYLSPLRILSIHPRPTGVVNLPTPERDTLKKLNESTWLEWKELSTASWKSLLRILGSKSARFNVFHFDGHGTFGKLCANCQTPNNPWSNKCKKCKSDIDNSIPLGYLDFEDDNKNIDKVQAKELKVLFTNSGFQIGVISACKSAEVDGVSVFNGIASGLIQSGFQAVIGMQGSPTVNAAAKFLDAFYSSLASGYPIYQAVTSGRLEIYREKPDCWFMPVLYMRESSVNDVVSS